VKGEAGRTVYGDNDAAAVEFVYEFFTNKGIYVAASDGGKYASAIITFNNIYGERCLDSPKPVGNLSLMIIHWINMSHILEYMV
jgi:hypothetical protein